MEKVISENKPWLQDFIFCELVGGNRNKAAVKELVAQVGSYDKFTKLTFSIVGGSVKYLPAYNLGKLSNCRNVCLFYDRFERAIMGRYLSDQPTPMEKVQSVYDYILRICSRYVELASFNDAESAINWAKTY